MLPLSYWQLSAVVYYLFWLVLLSTVAEGQNNDRDFASWKTSHGRSYVDSREEKKRYQIFKQNGIYIAELNGAQGGRPVFGHTKFSDMTRTEFAAMYLTYRAEKPSPARKKRDLSELEVDDVHQPADENDDRVVVDVVEEVDEKASNESLVGLVGISLGADPVVTVDWTPKLAAVRDQGACGSCWAFSAVAAMEGNYAIKYPGNTPLRLSEQHLVSCVPRTNPYNCYGCAGGYQDSAILWTKNVGVVSATAFPYRSGTSSTPRCSSVPSATRAPRFRGISSYAQVAKNVAAMQQALNTGVVAIGLCGDPLQFYTGSATLSCVNTIVRFGQRQPCTINHAIAAVGYGVDANGVPYWKCRNSWGTNWGVGGYINIDQTSGKDCRMLEDAFLPTMA